MSTTRRLRDLRSVGPATRMDLAELGINDVLTLADQDPAELYERLCELKGTRVDPCCHDVFACAVAQAKDPDLPAEQRDWWWWSAQRKNTQA